MDVIIPPEHSESYETEAKTAVLKEIEPVVEEMMTDHLKKRRLWFPSDFLPSDEQMDEDQDRTLSKLRERARGIADSVRVSVVLNLLTEEGLPHFHRIISRYLGDKSIWGRWNFMWTAEEDRHGCVLRDYARDARLFKWREVEMMQYAYQEAGFTPEWDKDPYRVFVYTTLQERATHYTFYRKVFEAILDVDPNRALQSAVAIMPSIEMPGISMPNFKEMADIVRRSGIYGPWDYKNIVEEAIRYWKIDLRTGLNEAGRKAQEKIMNIPKRLQKVAEYMERRSKSKSFSFDFIYGRQFSME